MAIAEPLGKEL